MKCYVTSRFKNAGEQKQSILSLCGAVAQAGFADVSFIRDVEQFNPHHFSNQQDVWRAARALIQTCDCLLIDVSDQPSGGRLIEAGMAYALNLPIFVAVKKGVEYKSFYEGIATKIIEYETFDDITRHLSVLSA